MSLLDQIKRQIEKQESIARTKEAKQKRQTILIEKNHLIEDLSDGKKARRHRKNNNKI
jgi:hypothetical protein